MKEVQGGVCAAKGFKATGLEVGIKGELNGKKDMAMIFCDGPCMAAGTFTSNLVKAAPVKWDRKTIDESGDIRAIVINSGIANACTGETGMEYCREISAEVSRISGVNKEEVLTASTGVIGYQLPIGKIKDMTTDTVSKQVAVKTEINGHEVTVGGMCKGSGMIHINMCTMLGFITTDVNISKEMLTKALNTVIPDTFNMVSVDGDTSTNDTVIILADGMAENEKITKEGQDYDEFVKALNYVCTELAKKIAGDGEGATKLFEVMVVNADTKENAVTLSKSVVTSSLTKAAIFGNDANWGRILCALGYSGAKFDPEIVDIYFESEAGKIQIVENGVATDYSEEEATKILNMDAVRTICDMKMGDAMATAYGCDLTYDYVKINADYRS